MTKQIHFASLSIPHRKIRNLKSFECLQIQSLKMGRLAHAYDYGLITSQVTVSQLKRLPRCSTWIAIGHATAEAFRRKFRRENKIIVLRDSHSQGIVNFFKSPHRHRGKVFFPRSKRGATEIPSRLRALGYRVSVRWAYRTVIQSQRHQFESWLIPKLERGGRVVILLTSPSTVLALRRSLRSSIVKHPLVSLVSIGPTTSKSLKLLGLKFIESPQPRLEKMQDFARRHLHVLWKKTH